MARVVVSEHGEVPPMPWSWSKHMPEEALDPDGAGRTGNRSSHIMGIGSGAGGSASTAVTLLEGAG
jgi:hypothetical protein